jgi:hypothetical protein
MRLILDWDGTSTRDDTMDALVRELGNAKLLEIHLAERPDLTLHQIIEDELVEAGAQAHVRDEPALRLGERDADRAELVLDDLVQREVGAAVEVNLQQLGRAELAHERIHRVVERRGAVPVQDEPHRASLATSVR